MSRRRIQPKPTLEFETVSLGLPAQLVRAVDQYAKFIGGSTDRTCVITQAIEITLAQDTDFQKTCLKNALTPGGARLAPPDPPRNTAVFTPALSATHRGPVSL